MCHLSPVTCHLSKLRGGSVINGAYPVYFILGYVDVYHCVSARESDYDKHDWYDGCMYTDEFEDNDDFDEDDVLLGVPDPEAVLWGTGLQVDLLRLVGTGSRLGRPEDSLELHNCGSMGRMSHRTFKLNYQQI